MPISVNYSNEYKITWPLWCWKWELVSICLMYLDWTVKAHKRKGRGVDMCTPYSAECDSSRHQLVLLPVYAITLNAANSLCIEWTVAGMNYHLDNLCTLGAPSSCDRQHEWWPDLSCCKQEAQVLGLCTGCLRPSTVLCDSHTVCVSVQVWYTTTTCMYVSTCLKVSVYMVSGQSQSIDMVKYIQCVLCVVYTYS